MGDDAKTTAVTVDDTKPSGGATVINRYYPSRPRHLFSLLLLLLLLAGAIALILYLVYRPAKPRFTVTSAAIYDLTPSPSASAYPLNTVSTSIQLTVVARNPSDRGSIVYDSLSAYIAYRDHPITQPVRLPPLAQDRDSAVAVSPVLGGREVPVSGEVAEALGVDRRYGVVELRFVMVGRVKYKTGPFRSGWNQLYVRCDVLVGIKKSAGGGGGGGGDGGGGQVPLIGNPQCRVDA